MTENPFPPHIHTLAIVSPAGLPDRDGLLRSIRCMREDWHLTVRLGPHALEPGEEMYFAADAAARAADFNAAIRDPETDLILCSRGGYGSMLLLEALDFATLRRRRLPVLGYSDITALHFAMLTRRAGIPVAAPMAASLDRRNPFTMNAMKKALAGGESCRKVCGPDGAPMPGDGTGQTAGRLLAGNLSLAAALCGTPYLPSFRNRIVVLEDIGEKPRLLDRHLTQLRLAGAFEGVAAVVFGDFTACGSRADKFRVLSRFATQIAAPVRTGFPFGHGANSVTLNLNSYAELNGQHLFFNRKKP